MSADRLEFTVTRDALAWFLLTGGVLWLCILLGAGGGESQSELSASDGGDYLAGVLVRSLSNAFQAALLAGLISVPLHAVWTFVRRGASAERAYDQFGLWAQVLFTSLGFMGTIIGVSLAVGGLETAMNEDDPGALIGGLSTAFDTTFLGLTAAVFLMIIRKWASLYGQRTP